MKVLTYRLNLEQPLLATQLAGDPNSSVSRDYVPGSLIRGLLISRYLRHNGLSTETDLFDAQKDRHANQLFFSQSVRYLNAYPITEGGERSLPTPRSLLKTKASVIDKNQNSIAFNASHPDWT